METPKMFFVDKQYAVREAKIRRYAVRKGGGGVTLYYGKKWIENGKVPASWHM